MKIPSKWRKYLIVIIPILVGLFVLIDFSYQMNEDDWSPKCLALKWDLMHKKPVQFLDAKTNQPVAHTYVEVHYGLGKELSSNWDGCFVFSGKTNTDGEIQLPNTIIEDYVHTPNFWLFGFATYIADYRIGWGAPVKVNNTHKKNIIFVEKNR